jgi:hypothetical protein
MNKAKSIILVPLILIGVVYLGLKAWVYFSVKSDVDNLVKQASLFVDVRYGGISSDLLEGSFSIDEIVISPRTLQDEIKIHQFKMQGDGPGFLFSDTSKMAQQTPEFLKVSMTGLRVGLDGELYSSMATMQAEQAKARKAKPAKTCEFGSSFSAQDLRALGYEALFANASFTVSHDKIDGKTKMEVNFDMDDMAEVDLTMSVKGGGSPMMMAMAPQPQEIRFVYSIDADYLKGSKKYCASVLKMDEQAYVDYITNAKDADYQEYYGFVPGPGIRQAVNNFMKDGGEIDIRMRPSSDINPMMLNQFRPADIINLLGVTLYVNGQPVQDLSFTVDESMNEYFGDKAYGETKDGKNKQIEEPVKVTYTFQDTPVNQLPQYIGARIKVTTMDGRERVGTLISISQNTAQIEQRVHSGKFEALVPLADIKSLQIHRLLKTEKESK